MDYVYLTFEQFIDALPLVAFVEQTVRSSRFDADCLYMVHVYGNGNNNMLQALGEVNGLILDQVRQCCQDKLDYDFEIRFLDGTTNSAVV